MNRQGCWKLGQDGWARGRHGCCEGLAFFACSSGFSLVKRNWLLVFVGPSCFFCECLTFREEISKTERWVACVGCLFACLVQRSCTSEKSEEKKDGLVPEQV